MSSEHGVYGEPHLGRRLERGDLCKNVAGEGVLQVAVELLLLCQPEGCHKGLFVLFFAGRGDGEGGGRQDGDGAASSGCVRRSAGRSAKLVATGLH